MFKDPAPDWFGPLNAENHCIICTTRLPHKLGLWNRNPHFRLWFHDLNFLAQLRHQPSKSGWAPVPNPWLRTWFPQSAVRLLLKFKELSQLSFNKYSLNFSSVHWVEMNVKQFGHSTNNLTYFSQMKLLGSFVKTLTRARSRFPWMWKSYEMVFG